MAERWLDRRNIFITIYTNINVNEIFWKVGPKYFQMISDHEIQISTPYLYKYVSNKIDQYLAIHQYVL